MSDDPEAWIVVAALMQEWEVNVVDLSDKALMTAPRPDKLRVERLYDRAGIRIIMEDT